MNYPAVIKLLTPGLDNTRLFMSLTAGAGTRCMSLLFHLIHPLDYRQATAAREWKRKSFVTAGKTWLAI